MKIIRSLFSRTIQKSHSNDLAISLSREIGKEATSGLLRLLHATSSRLTGHLVEGKQIHFDISNEVGKASASVDIDFLKQLALQYVSSPSSEVFTTIREDLWQVRPRNKGKMPLCLLPLNASIWKATGLGNEVVPIVREHEYSFWNHTDRLHLEVAKTANLFGVFDKRTAADFNSAVAGIYQPRKSSLMAWMRYFWKVDGTTLQVSNELKRMTASLDLSAPNLLFLASFFCDAGEYGQALTLARSAAQKSPNIWETHRIPAVTRLLFNEGLLTTPWAAADAELCNLIENQSDVLPRKIMENRESFAIVGNGPTQMGKGRGHDIDGKNIVIRMNTGGRSRVSHADDYGTKQTAWIRNQQNFDVRRMDKIPGIETVIISGANPLYKRPNSSHFLREFIRQYGHVTLIPEEALRKTIFALGTNPSSGIVALTWLKEIVGELKNQHNVFGFSLTDQKVRETTHYFREAPILSHHTHDWDAERKYFEKIVSP